MAYDASRQRTVLFGGEGPTGYLGETWEWNGTVWTQATPAGPTPSARCCHAMAYDSFRQRVVMIGGINGAGLLNDVWEFDGTHWTLRIPDGDKSSPTPRYDHAIAYDSSNGRIMLFGGYGENNVFLGDTWELPSGSVSLNMLVDQNAQPYDAVTFTIVATGPGVLTYQWRKNGVPLTNGGSFSGVTTASLTIDPVFPSQEGAYDVVVSNALCGEVVSNAAALNVEVPCPGDNNGDGIVNVNDLLVVVGAWGSCP